MVFVAIGSSYVTTQLPALKRWFKRLLTRSNKKSQGVSLEEFDALKTQVDNLAEVLQTRERNHKGNVRRIVREYLEELQK